MKISVVSIAHKPPKWVETACSEYLSRINNDKYSCNLIDLKSNKKYVNSKLKIEEESKKISSAVSKTSYMIILDENGKDYNSIQFANEINKIFLEYNHITFIIGGSDGINQNLKRSANLIIKLSSLTFPHLFVKILILEQIYRAITILNNHPYHRE